jgi:hypothetical protein
LPLPPSLVRSEHPASCAPCSFSVPCLFFFFFFLWDMGQSVQGAMLVYPRGSCGDTTCCLFAHLLVCISQTGLEPASGGTGALLFSQGNMVWRCFAQAGGLRCQSFAFSWCFCFFFFCQRWLQYFSKIFDLWSSCCLLTPSSHHLGSSPASDF